MDLANSNMCLDCKNNKLGVCNKYFIKTAKQRFTECKKFDHKRSKNIKSQRAEKRK